MRFGYYIFHTIRRAGFGTPCRDSKVRGNLSQMVMEIPCPVSDHSTASPKITAVEAGPLVRLKSHITEDTVNQISEMSVCIHMANCVLESWRWKAMPGNERFSQVRPRSGEQSVS